MRQAIHAVKINGQRVGRLLQRGDFARFVFDEGYWSDPNRSVLGLWFEDNPRASPRAALSLPVWFSNLLPEGPLRTWIARDRGVKVDRELELLLQIGHDLPGAVEVEELGEHGDTSSLFAEASTHQPKSLPAGPNLKFSLAGIGMKFSLLKSGDRLSIPGKDQLGNWIVKFPDPIYPNVPRNEYASMSLAAEVGIDCPRVTLISREEVPYLPDLMWPGHERIAYGVERFDRAPNGRKVHIEDFAQVRNFYPRDKYSGTFETVVALAFRGFDIYSLREAIRRLVFNLLIGNGDAHLKNWSLIYGDGRNAVLSPVYDLVSTAGYYYSGDPDDFGLKFGGTRRMDSISRRAFSGLRERLGVDASDVMDVVDETLYLFRERWSGGYASEFPQESRVWIESHLDDATRRLSRKFVV